MREIIYVKEREILIHRYNSRDDTYISYFKPKSLDTIYKNIWAPKGHTIYYEKRGK